MKAQKRIWWGLLALMQATAGRLYGSCVAVSVGRGLAPAVIFYEISREVRSILEGAVKRTAFD